MSWANVFLWTLYATLPCGQRKINNKKLEWKSCHYYETYRSCFFREASDAGRRYAVTTMFLANIRTMYGHKHAILAVDENIFIPLSNSAV